MNTYEPIDHHYLQQKSHQQYYLRAFVNKALGG